MYPFGYHTKREKHHDLQRRLHLPEDLLEQMAAQGFEALPELIGLLINKAMQLERQKYLRAVPFEHTPDRKEHANGYKPKTVKTRLGEITFAISQVREGGFYP